MIRGVGQGCGLWPGMVCDQGCGLWPGMVCDQGFYEEFIFVFF